MKAHALLLSLCLPPHAAFAATGTRFSLQAESRSYLQGEPVYLRIVSPLSRPPSLEEGTVILAIQEIDGHGEPEFSYRPPLRFRSRPREDAPLADSLNAGSRPAPAGPTRYVRYARLIADEGGLLFRKPGRYRLRLLSVAVASDKAPIPETPAPGSVLSDSLTLAIRAPVRPEDRRAFAILARNSTEYALAVYLEGGDQLAEGMAIIRGLAGFRNAYTRVASFVLSSDWSQDYTDLRGGASRPLDLGKALALAQWHRAPAGYIALRNAYRLQCAAAILAVRNPQAPGLAEARAQLRAFLSSLTPAAQADFRSF